MERMEKPPYGKPLALHGPAEHGVHAGIHRVKRIRKQHGLRCKQKKKLRATTNSNPSLPVAENLLEQKFEADAPNQAWVTDITYIPTAEGWLYLAGHKDLFTWEVVEYAMSERMTKNLVSQSLFRAVSAKRPAAGLIHHSDRGSQYCSSEFLKLSGAVRNEGCDEPQRELLRQCPHRELRGVLKNE